MGAWFTWGDLMRGVWRGLRRGICGLLAAACLTAALSAAAVASDGKELPKPKTAIGQDSGGVRPLKRAKPMTLKERNDQVRKDDFIGNLPLGLRRSVANGHQREAHLQ